MTPSILQIIRSFSLANGVSKFWTSSKSWRKFSFGPVAMFYRLGKNVPISNNHRRLRDRRTAPTTTTTAPPFSHEISHLSNSAISNISPINETALIVGVGPGYGFELARRFAASGMRVGLASRNAERLDDLVKELESIGCQVVAYGCDATHEKSVQTLFSRVSADLGTPHLVVYAVQGFCPGKLVDTEVAAFEESWRQNCLGGFIVAREAARAMVPLKRGSIILTGSTSSLIGRASHLNLAVGKFGLRAVAQVLAREISSFGVHIAHVVIDADVKESDAFDESFPQSEPQHLADAVFNLHRQPRTAWTSEMDFRPWNEKFWEHC